MNGVEMVVGKYMNDLSISAVCLLSHDDKVGEVDDSARYTPILLLVT